MRSASTSLSTGSAMKAYANAAPLVAAGADFLAVSGAVWNGDEAAAVRAFGDVLGQ